MFIPLFEQQNDDCLNMFPMFKNILRVVLEYALKQTRMPLQYLLIFDAEFAFNWL